MKLATASCVGLLIFAPTGCGSTPRPVHPSATQPAVVQSYNAGVPMCFDLGVACRFKKGNRSVTILISFSCRNWHIDLEGFGPGATQLDDLRVKSFSDDGCNRLVTLAKRAFPNEPTIQKLKRRM